MRALLQFFFSAYNLPRHSRVFKQALYLAVMVKCVFWLWKYEIFFGENSLIYRDAGHTNFIKDLAYVLYNNRSSTLALYFIAAVLCCCLFMLLRRKNSLATDFALWLLVENLHYSTYATLTGGDYLLNQLLFFNIFIAIDYVTDRGKERDVYVGLHNAALAAVMIQICLVYVVAGLSKLTDPHWLNGTAVEQINRISHFSMGWFADEKWNGIHRVSAWIVTGYQLLFPLLIWFRKIKIPLLILGALMHLYIAVMPGVVGFSLIMLVSYIFFLPEKTARAEN